MLDEYVHEVCAETKCYMGDRGEWVIYLDGVIYAKVIPEDAIQKQKAKSVFSDQPPGNLQKVEGKVRDKNQET